MGNFCVLLVVFGVFFIKDCYSVFVGVVVVR